MHARPALAGGDRCVGNRHSSLDGPVAVVVPGAAAVGGAEVLGLSREGVGVAVAAVATLRDVPNGRRGALLFAELDRLVGLPVTVAVVVDVVGDTVERGAVRVGLASLQVLQAARDQIECGDRDRAGAGPRAGLGGGRVVATDLACAVPEVAGRVADAALAVAGAVAADAVDAEPGGALGIRGAASGNRLPRIPDGRVGRELGHLGCAGAQRRQLRVASPPMPPAAAAAPAAPPVPSGSGSEFFIGQPQGEKSDDGEVSVEEHGEVL